MIKRSTPEQDQIDSPLLAQRPAVNPYRYAAHEVLNRLRWDIQFESWRSRQKLKALQNKHMGQKAVIVCNGPSLLKTDLSLLSDTFTFGLNKINLLFDRSSFRPSCIVAVNPYVVEQNLEFYNQTSIPLFFDGYVRKSIKLRENTVFLHTSSEFKFARDCSMSIHQGYTVTFVAMQLAFHMGFKKVALIGCDHSFATKGLSNKTVISGEKDENHFDSRYFAGGVKWQLPDLAGSEAAYILARDVFNLNQRDIVNATEGGQLEIFPRMKLDEFVNL